MSDKTTETTDSRDERRFKPKAVIVLNALLSGQVVEMEGTKWRLDDHNELCSIATNEAGEEKLLRCDCTIGGFVRMAESLDLAETFLVGAINVLRQGI